MNVSKVYFLFLFFLLGGLVSLAFGFGYQTDARPQIFYDSYNASIFRQLNIGFGDRFAFDFYGKNGETIWLTPIDLILEDNIANDPYYAQIAKLDVRAFKRLSRFLKRSKYLVFWIVKGWQETWFDLDKIQRVMDKGYIPVFLYWYFGDELFDMPSEEEVELYLQDVQRVAVFLSRLNGTKLFIFEPEFNKPIIINSEEKSHIFASIISDAIDIMREYNSDMFISLCMMDTGDRNENATYPKCGYRNCALGDKYEWNKPAIVYNDLLDKLDFISFQEMVAQFSRDPQNPGTWDNPNPKIYTDAEIGINLLPKRILNLVSFLHQKYRKPIFLPYIAIASATWHDTDGDKYIDPDEFDPEGWVPKINYVYKSLRRLRPRLRRKGLFGYAPMMLFDHPQHDYGGYQFFMRNEYHLGIIATSAEDEIDEHLYGDIEPKGRVLRYIFSKKRSRRFLFLH